MSQDIQNRIISYIPRSTASWKLHNVLANMKNVLRYTVYVLVGVMCVGVDV